MVRRHVVNGLILVVVGFGGWACLKGAEQPEPQRPPYVPGEYLIKVRPGVEVMPEGANFETAEGAGKVLKSFERLNVMLVKLPQEIGQERFQQIQANISRSPVVERVEPNYIIYADESPAVERPPDDPQLADMWFVKKIQALEAWNVQHDSPNVVVAVIDTGVFLGHEDLEGNIWVNEAEKNGAPNEDDDNNGYVDDIHGYDFYNNDGDPSADSVAVAIFPRPCIPHPTKRRYEAHGTHVAGTIGAVGNNGTGIAGLSWKVQIMPLKFLGGACGSGTTAGAIEALDYAVAHGAQIINASWGGAPFSQFLKDAIDAADSAGVLFVAAAGNTCTDNDAYPHYPSSYDSPNIIAVAATGRDDYLTDFSCFGDTSVDLAAPGDEILSTVPAGDENSSQPESAYAPLRGTSMATPVVSGCAALVTARFPTLTHLERRQLILQTVDQVPALQGKVVTGGRLNVARALGEHPLPVALAQQMTGPAAEEFQKAMDRTSKARIYLQKPFLAWDASTAADGARDNGAKPKEGDRGAQQFLVSLPKEVSADEVAKRLVPLGVTVEKPISKTRNVYLITVEKGKAGMEISEVLKEKQAQGVIKSFEPTYIITIEK